MIDKYEMIEQIGQGGMSKVYKVHDIRLQKYWAMKEINLEGQLKDKNILEQSIVGEMKLLKKLEHPALPRIVDFINKKTKIYMIMDYIEGETLREKIRREGPQKEEIVVEWALQLCDIIGYLHSEDIVYRDLKPSNIMINKNGKLRLIDFGSARVYKKNNGEDTIYLGTRGYAAPEQFGGKGQTDIRTDIYSMGITLYYLLTGKKLIYYTNDEVFQTCTKKIRMLIQQCVQIAPANRYQSFEEIRKELLECKKNYGRLKQEKDDLQNMNLGKTAHPEQNWKNSTIDAYENVNLEKHKALIRISKKVVILCSILTGIIIIIIAIAANFNSMEKDNKELQLSKNTLENKIEKSFVPIETILEQEKIEATFVPTEKVTVKPQRTKSPIKTKKPAQTKKPVQTQTFENANVPVLQTLNPIKTQEPAKANCQKTHQKIEANDEDMKILDENIVIEVIEQ